MMSTQYRCKRVNMQDFNPIYSEKLYIQIYNQLHDAIVSGKYRVGDKLPSEKELCTMFNVSRVPVRQDRDRAADMDGPPVRLERVLSLADSVTGIRAERDPETGRLNWLPLWKRNVSPTMIQTRRTTSVSTIRSM